MQSLCCSNSHVGWNNLQNVLQNLSSLFISLWTIRISSSSHSAAGKDVALSSPERQRKLNRRCLSMAPLARFPATRGILKNQCSTDFTFRHPMEYNIRMSGKSNGWWRLYDSNYSTLLYVANISAGFVPQRQSHSHDLSTVTMVSNYRGANRSRRHHGRKNENIWLICASLTQTRISGKTSRGSTYMRPYSRSIVNPHRMPNRDHRRYSR